MRPTLSTNKNQVNEMAWSAEDVDRGTKCFSPKTNGYPGGFPYGFLDWMIDNGWWGNDRIHVPCGLVADVGPGTVTRVDVKPNPTTNATHVFDAGNPDEWPDDLEGFDFALIDPPYSRTLAKDLYDTEAVFYGVDRFVRMVAPRIRPGGLLCTLSYQVPKRPGTDWNLIACWGIYQTISVAHIRMFQVWKKDGETPLQGLDTWS